VKTLLSIFVRVCLLALWFAVPSPAAPKNAKTKDLKVKAPPPPVPRKVNIDRGQQVTIPLEVYGPGADKMQYLIRTNPKVGRLSAVQVTGDMTAAVTYFVPEDTIDFQDKFTYAVRTADGVSAAVAVTINITEPAGLPPRLIVPGALDMEPIHSGETCSVIVPVKNGGGGFAEGELTVPEPWKIEGPGIFRLGGGSKTDFKVSYTGSSTGTFKADISYGRGYRVSTALNATVLQSITLTPALLELKAKPGAATRDGLVRIKNESTEPMIVQIKSGGKLLTETSATVPGRQTANLAVFVEPGEVGAIEERLQFRSGAWTAELAVISKALGPIVSCKEKSVSFTDFEAGQTASKNITLENTGGTAILLKFNVEEPFRTEPTTIALKPKSSATVVVACKMDAAGESEGKLTIEGIDTNIEIPLSAIAKAASQAAPQAPPEKAVASAIPIVAPAPVVKPEPSAIEALQKTTAAEVPNLLGKPRSTKSTSAIIEWKSAPKANLRAQERVVSASEGGMRVEWRKVKAVFSQEADKMLCEVSGLRSSSLTTIRIVAGDATECTVNLLTPASPPYLRIIVSWLVLISVVAAAGVLIWKRWQSRARSSW
jgi:hypothetical protein